MSYLINLLIVLATFLFMEAFAWFSHKYLLHGALWFIHKSHHQARQTLLEWNDVISLLYAGIAAALIYFNPLANIGFWVGIGISTYGFFYFMFHDVIIHRRIKIKYYFKHPYINRLIRAHKIHHKKQEKEGGEAFGFLYAAKKYEVQKKS